MEVKCHAGIAGIASVEIGQYAVARGHIGTPAEVAVAVVSLAWVRPGFARGSESRSVAGTRYRVPAARTRAASTGWVVSGDRGCCVRASGVSVPWSNLIPLRSYFEGGDGGRSCRHRRFDLGRRAIKANNVLILRSAGVAVPTQVAAALVIDRARSHHTQWAHEN